MQKQLQDSSQEQSLLRPIALWAADYVQQALPIFEERHPQDTRPRQAVEAARAFGEGKKRDKQLRLVALAATKAGKELDQPSKHVARAATLAAAVAYTHTDLQLGDQGIRQAQHILGPIVYAALALEAAANNSSAIGDKLIHDAAVHAPNEARYILSFMPQQPQKESRTGTLFATLDAALRA